MNDDAGWFLLGHFNDIAKLDDQQGGSHLCIRRCLNHQQQINALSLIDLGASGNRFTWRRNRLQVGLDRIYANMFGRSMFPNATVTNLPFCH